MNLPLTAISVVVYQVACTLFWPTPSEAPLLLYPRISLVNDPRMMFDKIWDAHVVISAAPPPRASGPRRSRR